MSPNQILELGRRQEIQSALQLFSSPSRRYLRELPRRYREFRERHNDAKQWFDQENSARNSIHPLEVDVVLLAMLRAAALVDSLALSQAATGAPSSAGLARTPPKFAQILVDEAPDFSPVQLACMAALGKQELRSFFACGDFNQRITPWGAPSLEKVHTLLPDLAVRSVSIAYRQSDRLHGFAQSLAQLDDTQAGTDVTRSELFSENNVAPVLGENLAPLEMTATWLADRVREIERLLSKRPTIAVIVPRETDVAPLSDKLRAALADVNIPVEACAGGERLGVDGAVRVFDVQHIKGLEFEAVLFAHIDRLFNEQPELFGKYLYVGATRAATYMGLACDSSLPAKLHGLRSQFATAWTT